MEFGGWVYRDIVEECNDPRFLDTVRHVLELVEYSSGTQSVVIVDCPPICEDWASGSFYTTLAEMSGKLVCLDGCMFD